MIRPTAADSIIIYNRLGTAGGYRLWVPVSIARLPTYTTDRFEHYEFKGVRINCGQTRKLAALMKAVRC